MMGDNEGAEEAMGIYEEIIDWSGKRPQWQRDALRRLARGGLASKAMWE